MLKRTVRVSLLVAVAALGCTEGPVTVETVDGPQFARVAMSTTSVNPFGGGAAIAGASATLRRTGDGVAVNLNTNGLTAGNAYTLWAFPGGVLVTGHVVGGSGLATFAGRINFPGVITKLIVRSHGPKLPGNAQFLTPGGGCNPCENQQEANFP